MAEKIDSQSQLAAEQVIAAQGFYIAVHDTRQVHGGLSDQSSPSCKSTASYVQLPVKGGFRVISTCETKNIWHGYTMYDVWIQERDPDEELMSCVRVYNQADGRIAVSDLLAPADSESLPIDDSPETIDFLRALLLLPTAEDTPQ